MPLSTGATWPALRTNFTAAAEDMTSKFEWLEGHRYPMAYGSLTTAAFDIGSTDYKWASGHFVECNSPAMKFTTIDDGKLIRAWANVDVSGGTLTVAQSFNLGSFWYNPSYVGEYYISINYFVPTIPVTCGSYMLIKHTPKTSLPIISTLEQFSHFSGEMNTYSAGGAQTDSSFCVMVYGPMNFEV